MYPRVRVATSAFPPSATPSAQVLVSVQGLILTAQPYFNEPGYEVTAPVSPPCFAVPVCVLFLCNSGFAAQPGREATALSGASPLFAVLLLLGAFLG